MRFVRYLVLLAPHILLALSLLVLTVPAAFGQVIPDPFAKKFGGETCLMCHGGAKDPEPGFPEETFDVVIVGGGMAGLSTLHYVQDTKALLLEAEEEPGGQMRADEWKGIRFAKGAAYLVEPYGLLREFYDSEKVQLVKIAEPENSAWLGGRFYGHCWTSHGRKAMPWTGAAKTAWVKFLEMLEDVNNTNKSNQPFECFDPTQQDLDKINALEWMQKSGLTPKMIEHFDRYVPSCFGETSEHISAAAFSNYISGEIGGNYTFPGGMGALTRHLYENHKGQIRLGARVTKVTQNLHEARVTYVDSRGRGHTVKARTVVMAVPCNLLPGIVPDLPAEKKAVIAQTRYASYMVAAVLMNKVMWDDKGYDTWIEGTFFRDIIDATWITRKGEPHTNKNQPHVLSLYIPTGGAGLKDFSEKPDSWYKDQILADLEKTIPGSRAHVAGIRLYRWGHSMHVAAPGFMSKSVPVLRRPWFRVAFAGAEVEGLPCNESAIFSGNFAARAVRTWLHPSAPSLRGGATH